MRFDEPGRGRIAGPKVPANRPTSSALGYFSGVDVPILLSQPVHEAPSSRSATGNRSRHGEFSRMTQRASTQLGLWTQADRDERRTSTGRLTQHLISVT